MVGDCPCGGPHPEVDVEIRQTLDLLIAQAGDPLIDVNLPDGRQYRVPRRYIALHLPFQAAMVPDLAARYGWARTR